MTQAHILVVDDEPDIRLLVSEILEDEGYRVTLAEDGEAARTAFARKTPDLVLLDIWMPDVDGILLLKEWSAGAGLPCPVIVMSGHGSVETAVEATRLGAYDFVQKPISLAKLLAIVSQALASRRTTAEPVRRLPGVTAAEPIGNSAVMQLLRAKAEQAAQHESPVLITGEPGSGRESLARYIHSRSMRGGDFVVLDHSQLEGSNARAYLLGCDQDNSRQPGLFDLAMGGTLFLSEIQELSAEARKIINQVFESAQLVHEGGAGKREINCRIIASGCSKLAERARRDASLEQLYYRLNVLPLSVPALRERPDDIPELVRFYADWFPNHEGLPYRSFPVSTLNRLRNHGWPGNVRELRNLVQRLLILGGEGDVTVAEAEEALRQSPPDPVGGDREHPEIFQLPLREAREQFEREYLSYQLQQAKGSVGKLAASVGMERTHLYRKLRALGIDPKSLGEQGASK
ncbi:MAG TPA: sigma-54 dependent transcriptional regulator [Xanthomonadales bacterium]|nr:sigma-54 dependent transcriptional regulator [Xanthomonadales bacterium]